MNKLKVNGVSNSRPGLPEKSNRRETQRQSIDEWAKKLGVGYENESEYKKYGKY